MTSAHPERSGKRGQLLWAYLETEKNICGLDKLRNMIPINQGSDGFFGGLGQPTGLSGDPHYSAQVSRDLRLPVHHRGTTRLVVVDATLVPSCDPCCAERVRHASN